ncbi:GspE/PulE family protein [Thauera chlorobenzoica]|uniref:GspE/PulE family protein n=1 Tax=Thauera chlorobenzoica TaxID=96773 RepID=UPI00089FD78F|nr:GspE/PulE family protein [Thauera chlorobenzoica]SEF76763.1 Type II secretory pathway ATPase GspE/PulE or T4P pilus assembly pathway ATPase PilB [Thauera chlorobenzoica]
MSNASTPEQSVSSAVGSRLAFFKGLQALTQRIQASRDVDALMLELAPRLCELFGAERLSIYTVEDGGGSIVTLVKTGLQGEQSIRLPLAESSIAGYVALHGELLNIGDVHDEAELRRISPKLQLRSEVDARSGFRSRQMLVAPLRDPGTGRILGVIQLINTHSGQPFPKVAEEGVLVLAQTLGSAFCSDHQRAVRLRSRFDALVADGRISAAEFAQATRQARDSGRSPEAVLIDALGLSAAELGEAAARFFGVPYQPYRDNHVKPMDLLRNIRREYVEQSLWLPYEETGEGVVILCVDPEQIRNSGIAQNVFVNKRLAFRVTTVREFEQTVAQYFGELLDDASVSELLSDLDEGEDEGGSLRDDVTAAADNELVKLVNKIVIEAYRQGASDIHIEPRPGREKTLVRFRKDGSLVPYIEVPASYRSALVTRIKIMCDLDISERRRPQDGKIRFRKFAPLDIELRVATLPTQGGMEDVVMRLLAGSEPLPLDRLGLLPFNLERLQALIARPYGIFFVCGPTGSGKTTTLHSVLRHINTPDTKIWTVEDPVEITQKGLRQVQVNRKVGIDFATMMRAFLRADPDVIMVGEMRDRETVAVGIEASLTGHLVLSTLHTNSAPESVVRLLDMGMDPFNFADALIGVLAQRLAKRLCPKCREAYHPGEDELQRLLEEYCEDMHRTPDFCADADAARARIVARWRAEAADRDGRFTLYRAVGCAHCTQGYKGRVGLHELMPGSDAIKRLIQERGRVEQVLGQALAEGMRTLRQDGIEKVLAGITDMHQVRKVCVR